MIVWGADRDRHDRQRDGGNNWSDWHSANRLFRGVLVIDEREGQLVNDVSTHTSLVF